MFAQLDAKRVSILCQHKDNVKYLAEFLELKGFRVEIESVPTAFFKLLENGRPGIVMVSSESEDRHGRVIAGFIQRKFKAPVLVYQESKSEMVRGTYAPEVQKVSGHNLEMVLDEIVNFKSKYADRLKETEKQVKPEMKQIHEKHNKLWADLESQVAPSLGVNIRDGRYLVSAYQPTSEDEQDNACYIFVFPEDATIEQRQAVVKAVAEKLKFIGEEEGEGITCHFEAKIAPEVMDKLDQGADRRLSGLFQNVDMNFVFLADIPCEPIVSGGVHLDVMIVPVEDWWAKYKLPVDLYLWMPQNARMFVLVNSGQSMDPSKVDKFRKQPDLRTGVPIKQARAYRVYRDLVYYTESRASL